MLITPGFLDQTNLWACRPSERKRSTVYSNRPPESFGWIWVAKEALFGALSLGFTVCLLWGFLGFFVLFVFWITLVVRPKSLHSHWVTHFLWPGLEPCHLPSWLPVAVIKSWGLLSTRTDTSLPFHTTVFQCLYCYRSTLFFIHSKVVLGGIHCVSFPGTWVQGREKPVCMLQIWSIVT